MCSSEKNKSRSFEKKLIYINSLSENIYPFLDSTDEKYKHRDNDRIWFDYKIQVTLDKVIGKHDKAVAKKSPQVDMFDKDK